MDRADTRCTLAGSATEVGYSETAFLAPRPDSAFDIRYFSPATEVPFCGHATVATGEALADRDTTLDGVTVVMRTATVPVAVDRTDGRVTATLTSPPARSAPGGPAVAIPGPPLT